MQTVYLANYRHARSILGWIIIKWSPPYSHDELVVDGVAYSSSFMDGGVRRKVGINFDNGHWDLIPVPWAKAENVIALYNRTRKKKYDIFGIIFSHLFNRTKQDSNKWFCSEWCAHGLGLNTSVFSPSSLATMVQHLNKIWYNNNAGQT